MIQEEPIQLIQLYRIDWDHPPIIRYRAFNWTNTEKKMIIIMGENHTHIKKNGNWIKTMRWNNCVKYSWCIFVFRHAKYFHLPFEQHAYLYVKMSPFKRINVFVDTENGYENFIYISMQTQSFAHINSIWVSCHATLFSTWEASMWIQNTNAQPILIPWQMHSLHFQLDFCSTFQHHAFPINSIQINFYTVEKLFD